MKRQFGLCVFLLPLFFAKSAYAQQACLPTPAGIVSWWSGEGSAADIVGANEGTLVDGGTFASAKVGQGFDIAGTGAFVEVGNNSSLELQQFSIEAWVYARSAGSSPDTLGPAVISKDTVNTPAGAGVSYGIFGPGAGGQFTAFTRFVNGTQPMVVSANSFGFGMWHHVAMTWDGNTITLYVNGLVEGSVAVGPQTIAYSPDGLGIGGHPFFNSRWFNGVIDEATLYNRALTPVEIAAIVDSDNAGKCPPPPPPPPPPPNCVLPPTAIVSWWTGDGVALDLREENHGTLLGATFGNGKVGQAFDLNGGGAFVRVDNSTALEPQQYSLEAWVYPRGAGSLPDTLGAAVISKDAVGTPAGAGVSYGIFGPGTSGKFTAIGHFAIGQRVVTSASSFQFGAWHHVAMTWDGNTLTLYVNGAVEGALVVGPQTVAYSTHHLGIGGHPFFNSRWFNGLIDEVSLYGRALSAAEVAAIANANDGGKCKTTDATPPVISPNLTGTVGANGWYTSDVAIAWAVTDPESAVTSQNGCDTTHVINDTAGSTFICTATSAGGAASQMVTIRRDASPPIANLSVSSGTVGSNGWYVANVTVHTSGTDPTSGPVTCTADQFQTTDTSGTTFTGSCTNQAGLTQAAASLVIQVDKTPPVITLTSPSNGAAYLFNQTAIATFSCDDPLSGVASCGGSASSGSPLLTSQVGAHSFVVSTTDRAGNVGSATATYIVQYVSAGACLGAAGHQILDPVNADGTSVFRRGRTVPAKFRVCDANGTSIGAGDVVTDFRLVQVIAGTVADVNEVVPSTTPDQAFRWAGADQQWIFNMDTSGLTTNRTYVYRISLNDGSSITFKFGVR